MVRDSPLHDRDLVWSDGLVDCPPILAVVPLEVGPVVGLWVAGATARWLATGNGSGGHHPRGDKVHGCDGFPQILGPGFDGGVFAHGFRS